jgi:tRNA(fMet)-specific endonuclease VapC
MENQICIDTDIIIDHLRGSGPGVKLFEEIITRNDPFTTNINKFELLSGARGDREIKTIRDCLAGFTILPFDEPSCQEAARIYRELRSRGQLIGVRDIMIAGIALANNIVFATKNINEFKRVRNLKLMKIK